MNTKKYGEYDAQAFKGIVRVWIGPAVQPTDECMLAFHSTASPAEVARFQNALREFILDPSMTWAEKGREYLDNALDTGEDYYEHVRQCWEVLFPDEPWPVTDESQVQK
jgi:hypothetical protein